MFELHNLRLLLDRITLHLGPFMTQHPLTY